MNFKYPNSEHVFLIDAFLFSPQTSIRSRHNQCGDGKYCERSVSSFQMILITDVGKNNVGAAVGEIWISYFRHMCLLWMEL